MEINRCYLLYLWTKYIHTSILSWNDYFSTWSADKGLDSISLNLPLSKFRCFLNLFWWWEMGLAASHHSAFLCLLSVMPPLGLTATWNSNFNGQDTVASHQLYISTGSIIFRANVASLNLPFGLSVIPIFKPRNVINNIYHCVGTSWFELSERLSKKCLFNRFIFVKGRVFVGQRCCTNKIYTRTYT